MKSLATALTLALAVSSSVARAQPGDGVEVGPLDPSPPRLERERGGWDAYLHPERQQGERYMRYGLAKLVHALRRLRPEVGDPPRHVLLEQALVRFERARESLGDDPELAYYVAQAITHWERPASDGGIEFRTDDAIAAWHHLRALAPEHRPGVVSAQLALLHMRRQELPQARAEYERALRAAVPRPVHLADRFYLSTPAERALGFLHRTVNSAGLYGNLAEVLMLTGDVEEAARSYRAAIDHAEEAVDPPITRSLAQWGLALALDRAGDHDAAVRQAEEAVLRDPIPDTPGFRDLREAHGAFSVLHLDQVFFEPAYEIHAYEALGHEAMARDPGEGQRRHLRSALRSWRLFLAEGGTSSRFGQIARAHAERLEEGLRSEREASPPRRGRGGRGRGAQPRRGTVGGGQLPRALPEGMQPSGGQ